MTILSTLIASARVPFLILAPATVLLGLGFALQTAEWSWSMASICLVGALSAHISVNALNEYEDFKTGLDLNTQRTAFSGGSGALPQQPMHAQHVKWLGYIALGLTLLIGAFVSISTGWEIIPLGALGVAIILTYTPLLNKQPLLCLLAPGISFGLLIPLGCYFVLTGEYSFELLIAGIPIALLVNNLLLLNQYPDREADAIAGRRHLIIHYGPKTGLMIFMLQWALAASLLVTATFTELLPVAALIALVPMSLGLIAAFGAARYLEEIGGQPFFMAANVGCAVLTPLFLGLVFLFS